MVTFDLSFYFRFWDFGLDLGFKEITEGERKHIQANYQEGKHP
jgi:hypothetical protein